MRFPLPQSDTELVEAAGRGDLESFGLLYERHYKMAVGIARCRLRDTHLAEDAAQEAFAIAYRTLSTLQQGDRFPQWLGTICRRTASRLATGRPNHEPLSESQEPFRHSASGILHQQVHEVLEQLDDVSREIVMLHYFSRLSYEEIADVLQLSISAIHGRLQRSRRRLASLLTPVETAPPKGLNT